MPTQVTIDTLSVISMTRPWKIQLRVLDKFSREISILLVPWWTGLQRTKRGPQSFKTLLFYAIRESLLSTGSRKLWRTYVCILPVHQWCIDYTCCNERRYFYIRSVDSSTFPNSLLFLLMLWNKNYFLAITKLFEEWTARNWGSTYAFSFLSWNHQRE